LDWRIFGWRRRAMNWGTFAGQYQPRWTTYFSRMTMMGPNQTLHLRVYVVIYSSPCLGLRPVLFHTG
jgi:hypothetical protein